MKTIGQRIKYLREVLNLSQQDVADSTGISRGNISNYEKDRVSPTVDTIVALCKFLNVSADWLLTGKDAVMDDSEDATVGSDDKMDTATDKTAKSEDETVSKLLHIRLTGEECMIIDMYRDFSPNDREFIRKLIFLKHDQLKQGLKKKNMWSIWEHGKKANSKMYA